jgi:hypothetical protein
MDISRGKAVVSREDEGMVLHIRDETGEKAYQADGATPVTITVVGSYSSRYRKAMEVNRERAVRIRRKLDEEDMVDEIDRQGMELLASCVVGWDGFTADGKPVPFSKENTITILTELPWVREQVNEAIVNHAGFTKRASAR